MGHPKLKTIPPEQLESDVRAAQQGDEPAFSRLVTQTKDRLYRFLFFLSGDTQLAHDLCQDTYLYALENLKKLKEPLAFPRWLFLIGKNRFLDHRRSPKNQRHDPVDSLDTLKLSTGEDRETMLQTRRVLSQLSTEDQLALLAVDLEGYSYAEASEIVGISENALRSRLHRAREAFHKIFFRT